jgi:hypothetical protein
VKLRRKGRRVTIVVSDGRKGTASTLRKGSVKVSFGERGGAGASASAAGRRKKAKPSVVRVRHLYRGSGRFRIRVGARDRAGNRASWTKVVRVR